MNFLFGKEYFALGTRFLVHGCLGNAFCVGKHNLALGTRSFPRSEISCILLLVRLAALLPELPGIINMDYLHLISVAFHTSRCMLCWFYVSLLSCWKPFALEPLGSSVHTKPANCTHCTCIFLFSPVNAVLSILKNVQDLRHFNYIWACKFSTKMFKFLRVQVLWYVEKNVSVVLLGSLLQI